MNTKFAAYATAAVLIGLAVMMLPLALEQDRPQPQPSSTGEQRDQPDGAPAPDNAYGLASQPSNLMPSSLILLVGLIFAFAAYIIVKKQVNPPPAFSYWYKPF